MLISRAMKKLVLHLRNTAKVTTVIPTAKVFNYKGTDLVAVPHNLDETRVLRTLGFNAPSPIRSQYKWSGQHTPFKAQEITADFLTLNPRAFCLNDMGTGKTLSVLWAYDYLRSIGEAHKMLVVAPLSTLERTWADEVFRHFPHLNTSVLYGTKERRLKLLESDADIYVINHDGMKVIEEELIARTDIDVLVVDEIASFRNSATNRWKCLRRVAAARPRLWGLTGTPTPNLPTDAWAQCRLIAPERVPPYFGRFRDMTMKQHGPFKWLPRQDATEIVVEAMQPAIRFTRDQCVDLPPAVYLTREAELTPEQAAAYKDMRAKLLMEYQEDQVRAVNEAVKMQKLVQIACGVVYGTDGTEVALPNKPRMDVVREVIEEAGTKVIVFVPFKAALKAVAAELANDYEVVMVSGETSKTERDRIFGAFQRPLSRGDSTSPRVLVAQPAAMSHGLTLTAANTVVWYAPITSNETYLQANARVSRPGQKHTQFIVNVEGTEVERRIYARLRNKETLQGLLLDALKER